MSFSGYSRWLAALCLLSVVGCASGGTGGVGGGGGSTDGGGDFAIGLSSGLTPTINWPGANALGLAIAEYPGTSVRLWVLATTGAGFGNSVVYATVPTGATQAEPSSGAPAAIVSGKQYVITITRSDGKAASQVFSGGTAIGPQAACSPPGDGTVFGTWKADSDILDTTGTLTLTTQRSSPSIDTVGTYTLDLNLTSSATAARYPGCHDTTRLLGSFTLDKTAATTNFVFVSAGTSNRTGCTNATDNAANGNSSADGTYFKTKLVGSYSVTPCVLDLKGVKFTHQP